jgi:hypothetical protein
MIGHRWTFLCRDPDSPWKALAPVDRSREYLALLSSLPLRKYRKIPRFLPFPRPIQRQLRSTPGATGYCLRAKPLCRKFWTPSVWENERALMDFVAQVPHGEVGEVMKALAPHRVATKLTPGKIRGSAIPSHGDEATRRELQES